MRTIQKFISLEVAKQASSASPGREAPMTSHPDDAQPRVGNMRGVSGNFTGSCFLHPPCRNIDIVTEIKEMMK